MSSKLTKQCTVGLAKLHDHVSEQCKNGISLFKKQRKVGDENISKTEFVYFLFDLGFRQK